MAGKPISIRALRGAHQAQVPPRLGVRIVVAAVLAQLLLLAALLMLFPSRAGAQGVKGEIAVNTQNGYARLVFTLTDEVEADVKLSNGILIIAFKRPVELSADRIVMQAGNYVSAARVDPDFTAVRMALNRKVTVNTMAAGEKLFVDLLPENWTGLPPGLPQEVVDELARRARDAEKRERARKQIAAQRNLPPVRVRVGTQPTFTRYTFELPALIPVSIDRTDGMTMTFESPLRFDLADVQTALPPMVSAVEAKSQPESALVHFDFVGKVDVRTFREDNNYIVDVQPLRGAADAKKDQSSEVAAAAARMAQKKSPMKSAPAAAPEHAAPPEKAPAQAAAPEHAAAEPTPPKAAPAPAEAAPQAAPQLTPQPAPQATPQAAPQATPQAPPQAPPVVPMPAPRPAQAPAAVRSATVPLPVPRPAMPASPPVAAAPQAAPPAAPPPTAPQATQPQAALPESAPAPTAAPQPAQAAPVQVAPAAAEPARAEAPRAETPPAEPPAPAKTEPAAKSETPAKAEAPAKLDYRAAPDHPPSRSRRRRPRRQRRFRRATRRSPRPRRRPHRRHASRPRRRPHRAIRTRASWSTSVVRATRCASRFRSRSRPRLRCSAVRTRSGWSSMRRRRSTSRRSWRSPDAASAMRA